MKRKRSVKECVQKLFLSAEEKLLGDMSIVLFVSGKEREGKNRNSLSKQENKEQVVLFFKGRNAAD